MKIENKIVDFISGHVLSIFLITVTILGLLIRIGPALDFVSGDASIWLLPWYDEIKNNGGFHSLEVQVGDYNMLYQTMIAAMTYIPRNPLYLYKVLSMIFDFGLAGAGAWMIYSIADVNERTKKIYAVLVYSVILFSPIVVMNSALWAQCDAMYSFFAVTAIIFFLRGKYTISYIMYGISFALKLQAIFILPFFVFMYFMKRKHSVLKFSIVPVTMCVVNLPAILFGDRGIGDIFKIYFQQTNNYRSMALNFPSFWSIISLDNSENYYNYMKQIAIIFTIVIIGAVCLILIYQHINFTKENSLYLAFIFTYTCVLFLPAMHERYGFLCEILGILIVFLDKETIPLIVGMHLLTLITYGSFLFGNTYNPLIMSIVNTLLYLAYLAKFYQRISTDHRDAAIDEM